MIIKFQKQLPASPPVEMSFSQRAGYSCTLMMLPKSGYLYNCGLPGNHIYCYDKQLLLHQHEFVINGMFYFPPDNNVCYERMIYTIEACKRSFRATLLMDAEIHGSVFSEMINRKLQESVFSQRKIFDHGIL